ncbi:MAG TPA: YceI family protein [Bacteroidia bacterium]|jgi:polyisoprenoid-binding protein YceI|nr:YceI family protein [Bacteroidia bacterium]
MNKLKIIIPAAATLVLTAFSVYKGVNWKVKDDYTVQVYQSGTKFITFRGLKAEIILDKENAEKSKISATIDSDVITVEPNQALENAAESQDVLDIKNFPVISFESSSIRSYGDRYEAIGKLTIKNVTKEIKIQFTFENEILKGDFNVNLPDFNINHHAFTKQLQIVLTIPVTK